MQNKDKHPEVKFGKTGVILVNLGTRQSEIAVMLNKHRPLRGGVEMQ